MSRRRLGASLASVSDFDDLLQRWRTAETRGDAAALEALLDPDFRGDGPGGTVLDKAQWLAAHRAGELRRAALTFHPTAVDVGAETAVATGATAQLARYRGADWSGAFLCTVVAVCRGGRWAIVNVQLSDRLDDDRPPRGADVTQVADVLRAALYERSRHGKNP